MTLSTPIVQDLEGNSTAFVRSTPVCYCVNVQPTLPVFVKVFDLVGISKFRKGLSHVTHHFVPYASFKIETFLVERLFGPRRAVV